MDDDKEKWWDYAYAATPDCVLEEQLRDSRIPKTELAHYALKKIERLESENERLRFALIEVADLVRGANFSKSRYPKANAAIDAAREGE